MRQRLPIIFAALLVIVVGGFHHYLKPQPTSNEINSIGAGFTSSLKWQGRLAPDFDLVTTSGQAFKLSDNVGKKVIVLNFFATWCDPCRAEMPELNSFYNQHKAEAFTLIAIDSRESKAQVAGFLKDLKLDFAAGVDTGPIEKEYGVSAFPTTVVIGADGKILLYQVGALVNADVALARLVKYNEDAIGRGSGISAEAYFKQLHKPGPKPAGTSAATTLDPRGKRIAEEMFCPCGCDKRINQCSCHTARQIQAALASGHYGNRKDADIIRHLDKKYCMAGM